jgi:hypothetical protein
LFVFAGVEDWCIREEFRPGKQHGQKGATAVLWAAIQDLRTLAVELILIRLEYLHGSRNLSGCCPWDYLATALAV